MSAKSNAESASKNQKLKTKTAINKSDYLAPQSVQRAPSIVSPTQSEAASYKYLTPTSEHNESNQARPSIINETSLSMTAAKRVSDNISRYSRSSVGSSNKIKIPKTKDHKLTEFFEDPRYKANKLKKQRKHDIQKMFNDHPPPKTNPNTTSSANKTAKMGKSDDGPNYLDSDYKVAQCHMTFIFDPNGRLSYWMSFVVSLAFLYNFWVMIYRYSFNEINAKNKLYWFAFDYLADFLYICDIMFNFRTGFLEEGVLQTDPIRLRHHYMNTTRFYVDCLCLMPLDILYLSIGYNSILRCFRLVKIYRFWGFLDRTERHTNFPNLFRTVVMLHYLFAIFHWNSCFSYFISHYLSEDLMVKSSPVSLGHFSSSGLKHDKQSTTFLSNEYDSFSKSFSPYDTHQTRSKMSKPSSLLNDQELLRDYLKAFYFSTKIMTLVTEMPNPKTSTDYIFAIVQLVAALLLFATIMGHVSYIVSNLGNARKEFQSKLDAVKTYMSLRRVPQRLQDRVIRWFDFLWTNHKSIDDNQVLNLLPYKLRAEIAIHVHLDTLKRVEIFQNTEAGFLNELVLRLKPVLYSPGDFICRKGEVGKEMYIVNGGKLHVISDNGKIVLATLKAGSYFGEISILNMGASGNRRTASVKSVGYSDLFCLSKEDLWEVLKEYPAVRVKLEAIAVKRLEKHKKPLAEIINLARCKSAPGLIEASLKQLPPSKGLKRYGTLPTSLLKRTDITLLMNGIPTSTTSRKSEKMIKHQPKLAITNEQPSTSKQTNEINSPETNKNQTGSVQKATTPTVLYNPTKLSLSSYPFSTKTNESNSNARSILTEDCQTLNEKSPLTSESNTQSYEDEIERLKKYIYYLEAENSSLFSKIDKKNWNIAKNMDDIDIDLKMTKAKIDSDSDEYRV